MSKQYPLPLPHSEAMEADNFMVTSSNQEAIAWLDKWPDWPTHCLIIYGPSGSGKTHLAQVWKSRSKGLSLDPEQLVEVRESRIFAIDNADKIVGNARHEEALFHLYNNVRDAKGFMLLTSEQAPAHWGIKLADLRSRLLSVPAIAITAPDDGLLSALLIKQFRDRQIDISLEVVDYLLPRMTRTPSAIRTLVTALDRASLAEGRGITIALARKVLEDQDFLIS